MSATPRPAFDPLPSWNKGGAKAAILDFVASVTKPTSPDFVPASERIAVFDNDGTLWQEQPIPVQLAFAFDRVKALAPMHPEWKKEEPFKSVLEGDAKGIAANGEKGVMRIMAATHVGNTTEEFERIVRDWIESARHPKLGRRYADLTYQPMHELLVYLRAHGFKTYLVTGGGIEFTRPWVERVYGIPAEHVIGSRARMKYEYREGAPVLFRLADIDLVDDAVAKPVAIQQVIGRRPIAAFGNSDGDLEMLEWATTGPGARLGLLVHHTDAAREFAYDRGATFARLERALEEAPARRWVVADMKTDWNQIFGTRSAM